ncbi:hypothetical protein OnM2_044050 [Erysiphe neolycopersici]|uniref:Uncharacterized protein n=1 Tax=Erysiphe neolycopersici TaxID=212602 RepID=A0A420HUT7_9PEZI|nr:hypothetical protein OnM2_044050 [Erysiphe neolycopersici]
MEDFKRLPGTLSWLQSSLEPFIKPRKTVLEVRKILRLYLISHIENQDQQLINRPLLLPDNSIGVKELIDGVKGLQREYLRCLDLNIKVKNEYFKLSSEHRSKSTSDAAETTVSSSFINDNSISSIDSFADLIKKKKRQSRLSIIQFFMEKLEKKPAAADDFFDPKVVLREVATIPHVPSEVIQPLKTDKDSSHNRISTLISHLEKAVFLARKRLEEEQKLLSNKKYEQIASTLCQNSRLFALQVTRNELIKWIEAELPKTDEMPVDVSEAASGTHFQGHVLPNVRKSLESLTKLYFDYIEARKLLLAYSLNDFESNVSDCADQKDIILSEEQPKAANFTSMIFPYFSELSSLSNQQRVFIQQKLHLATNLTKQLEEANQGFERQAQESHLLPIYPISLPDLHRRQCDSSTSFADTVSSQGRPDLYRHGIIWAHAAQSAGRATMDVVLRNSEMGNLSLSEVQKNLGKLDHLIGNIAGNHFSNSKHDIWFDLERNIETIKAEIIDSD